MSHLHEIDQPVIINDPYEPPKRHWVIEKGEPARLVDGRRDACYYYRPPGRSTGAGAADDVGTKVPLDLVNEIRKRLDAWRPMAYAGKGGVSATTAELLRYWSRPERATDLVGRRLFYCQREAAETIIFLAEAREDFLMGLAIPRDEPSDEAKAAGYAGFTRYALKMATGSGKTTAMGMLAAWSILNKVANRSDARYSEVVLIICPNVTIRERLQELLPERDEASLYRTRDLVPPALMSDLRKGKVVVTNWHNLAPLDLNRVGKDAAAVVNRGEESDTALVGRVLGPEVGGRTNILVMNDEAHHAYRIRALDNTAEVEDEDEEDRREATVWISGLDKIQRVRGVNFCVDLSATPFYLNRTGNDPGRPFPWIVSDFGLIDAIESGLVKIPQIPIDDPTGEKIAVYFNIWKWIVETKLTPAEKGGKKGQVNPKAVLKYAAQPIAILAGKWLETFKEWKRETAEGRREPVPPVFIVVCKDTRLAKVVYDWIALGESDVAPPPLREFRNKPGRDGREYTVRVDSKVVKEMEGGQAKSDEARRLRFVLDTVGRTAWPGGAPPEEYVALCEKMNRKAADDEGPPEDRGRRGRRLDPMIPPGRDVRCIVSVAMLTEGWDARTVTHIVGLRPFDSQLLCEQVIGRALRRSQYHDLTVEEVAKVYGVPFELIPLKATPRGAPPPPPKVHHVRAVSPERDAFEIRFPRVEGYAFRVRRKVSVDWAHVATIRLDPTRIPDETLVKDLAATESGRLTLAGPGRTSLDSLKEWRETVRIQELEYEVARELTRRYAENPKCEIPVHALFPQMLAIVRRFVREKVEPLGGRDRKDVFLPPYYQWVIERIIENIRPDVAEGEAPELPRYETHRGGGSTAEVDFWTSKDVVECERSHLNYAVADTKKWEQIAKFYIDRHENVVAFARNFNLGFAIPYVWNGEKHEYVPDFLIRLRHDGREVGTLILEVKGHDERARMKREAAERWCAAVTNDGRYGLWTYDVVYDPTETEKIVRAAAGRLAQMEERARREPVAG